LNHFTETRLQTALTELTNLTNYMRSVQQADDPGQKAFELAKQRMESSAVDPISKLNQLQKNAPAPLQSWLTNVAQNSWSILLQQAHSYINSAWQSGVIPQYNAVIANRYPVDKTAAQDIQLKDFVNFFGPNGVMQSFFTQFLSPFVNTDNAPWALRVKNGVSLPIAQGVLKQFERAVLIRHMFFNGNQKIAMQFALVPVAFKRDDQAVSLVVNGQKSQFVMNSNKPQTYNWPGNANLTQTILSFLNTKGQTYTETKSGPWALFRLLSESSLSQTTDSKEFEVVFDYKGNAAKFKLYADNNINPFIPGIVDQFRCPVII